jgi:hypothetical protein
MVISLARKRPLMNLRSDLKSSANKLESLNRFDSAKVDIGSQNAKFGADDGRGPNNFASNSNDLSEWLV